MTQEIHNGLPSMSLLPLANANFMVIQNISISLPRKGNYHELLPEIFDEAHGDFNILDNNILYLPSITKVLLAVNKYPALKQNQIFTPSSFEFKDDSVTINGSILEILNIESNVTRN